MASCACVCVMADLPLMVSSDQLAEKDALHRDRDAGRQSHRDGRVHQGLQGGVQPGRQDVHGVQDGGRAKRPREAAVPR